MAQKIVEWPGALKAYETAYKQIMKNPAPMWFFVAVSTVVTVWSMAAQGVTSIADKGYDDYASALIIVFIVPLINYAFSLVAGKQMTISEFMQFSLKKLLLVIVLSVMVVFIAAGSLILLIIPAIWTIAWFAQSMYCLIDKNLSPIQALKDSKRISEQHKSKVWGLIGVSFLFGIFAGILSIAPVIGPIFTAFVTVLSTVAATNLYKWLDLAAK
jgi:hypothetical protein